MQPGLSSLLPGTLRRGALIFRGGRSILKLLELPCKKISRTPERFDSTMILIVSYQNNSVKYG